MSGMIWIPHNNDAWEPVHVVSHDNTTITVQRKDGSTIKINGNIANFDTVTTQALDENCENLVNLESYSEGIILHHVKKRFATDTIYTLVGNILIALNPYKRINIYDMDVIDKIFNNVKRNQEPIPHVFTIAAKAIHGLREEKKDQSVLISGESGAGKTEATKKILQFLSTVCGSTASRTGRSIETQILDSNPLLESFGNAKTIRNNNSSRFGKYMEINFDKKYNIKGGNVTAYLLEKSRVVKQGPQERNYHIFYMLLAGASKEMRMDFMLKPADQFAYLIQSNCLAITNRNETEEFEELVSAMQHLNIDQQTQYVIFQIVAAILHLGNIQFVAVKGAGGAANANNGDGSKISNPSAELKKIGSLLGLDAERLEIVLCNKDTNINGETLLIPLTPEKASDQRDSLAKFLYQKVFDYIVYIVNASLYRGKIVASATSGGGNIGVLDIFGFEVFQLNSFEQLCINYCNERLQTFFNEIIFDNEMKLYLNEDLPIGDISYQDNIGCVKLIDQRGAGIFAYLDEETTVPKGSDEKLVSKLNQIFDENATSKSLFFQRNHKSNVLFTVRHFAGDVHYNATNFLEKNRDAIPEALLSLISSSSLALLNTTYSSTGITDAAAPPTEEKSGKSGGKKNSRLTLSGKFKADLDNLMNILHSTIPHFVRCIKPNLDQVPVSFDANLVLNQLKYSGLFEAIRIRKSGYEIRINHEEFLNRYKHCYRETPSIPVLKSSGTQSLKELSALLFDTMMHNMMQQQHFINKKAQLEKAAQQKASKGSKAVSASTSSSKLPDYTIGKTKVFIRSSTFKVLLDEYRDTFKHIVVVHIQRLARGFITRMRYRDALQELFCLSIDRKHQLALTKQQEDNEKRLMSIEDGLSMKQELLIRNDVGLQTRLQQAKIQRQKDEQTRQKKRRDAAILLLQSQIRGYLIRRKVRVILCEKGFERALESRSEQAIQKALQRPKQWKVTSKLIKMYSHAAKELVLQVMHENYVNDNLLQAIAIKSIPMLQDAVKVAKTNDMLYVPAYSLALQELQCLQQQKLIIHLLTNELSKCVNMPTLLRKYDSLVYLVEEGLKRPELTTEEVMLSAMTRIQKIDNLVRLRQELRFALEICSPTKMKRLMMQRKGMVRMFGEDFLAEEANAVDKLLSMLNYKQSLLTPTNITIGSQPGESKNDVEDMKELMMSTSTTAVMMDQVLDHALLSTQSINPEGLSYWQQQLTMHEIFALVLHKSNKATPPPPPSSSSSSSSSAKAVNEDEDELIYLPKFVRDPLLSMRYATTPEELQAAITSYIKVVPHEFHRRFYLRIFKWTIAFATWNQPNVALQEIKANIEKNDAILQDLIKQQQLKEMRDLMQQQQSKASSPGKVKFQVSDTDYQLYHLSSATKKLSFDDDNATSPSPDKRTVTSKTLGTFGTFGSTATKKTIASDHNTTNFTQRQAKSSVAAREILKKGKKYHFRHYETRSDQLLHETIASYNSFHQKVKKHSTWA